MADTNGANARSKGGNSNRSPESFSQVLLILLIIALVAGAAALLAVYWVSPGHIVLWQLPIIAGGACIGLFLGGFRVPMSTEWLAARYNLDLEDTKFDVLRPGSESVFLTLVCAFLAIYLVGYGYVMWAMQQRPEAQVTVATSNITPGAANDAGTPKPATAAEVPTTGKGAPTADASKPQMVAGKTAAPTITTADPGDAASGSDDGTPSGSMTISIFVVIVNALAAGAMTYFAARYCAFVRLLVVFDLVLQEEFRQFRTTFLPKISRCIHHEETWFEPPGNIFVTIGLASTFLGLAAALGTLDISGLLNQLKQHVSTDQLQPQNASAMQALTVFVRCMGLGLGMSMLGVLIAMAAQWLRGKSGPSVTTDELLERCYGARDIGTPDKSQGGVDKATLEAIQGLAGEMSNLRASVAEAASKYAARDERAADIEPLVKQMGSGIAEIQELKNSAIDIQGTLHNIEVLLRPGPRSS